MTRAGASVALQDSVPATLEPYAFRGLVVATFPCVSIQICDRPTKTTRSYTSRKKSARVGVHNTWGVCIRPLVLFAAKAKHRVDPEGLL